MTTDDPRTIEALIRKYLPTRHAMQLATVSDGRPWICTVYYVTDDDLNFYWISTPRRRHSREIEAGGAVAVAVAVQTDESCRVIGIQAEGEAVRVNDPDELKHGVDLYHRRFDHDPDFVQDFVADRRQHKLYRFRPSQFVLFDEQTFSENARKEWRPSR